ncbi:hypothetical protein AURDEDRAFT_131745 [Auricularia subglabra TFB-10046 SS5]|uniref:Uncharacterized protein n=1 Tax=Auricularia subglabra (strain TFB-10046 / SS5) TaxID=717982 RepID=J0WLW9_AURST|nr:hypothetical protein AURDEDRAFT_131745 [Auricularia subglabra TFB-10046 SS5]
MFDVHEQAMEGERGSDYVNAKMEFEQQIALLTVVPHRSKQQSLPRSHSYRMCSAVSAFESGPRPPDSSLNGHLSASSRVSNEIWTHIFRISLTPQFSGKEKYVSLIRASRVCNRWRHLILTTPSIWTLLYGLSPREIMHIDRLMIYAADCPVDIEIDCTDSFRRDYSAAGLTLFQHMSHITSLSLMFSVRHMESWHTMKEALTVRAPILRTFKISFMGSGVTLPSGLFGDFAPMLLNVTGQIRLLPRRCNAFSNVVQFTVLHDTKCPREEEARTLMSVCPRLEALVLDSPVVDSPYNFGNVSKERFLCQERIYGGSHRLKHLSVADIGELRVPRRRLSRSSDNREPGSLRFVIPTIQLFGYEHIRSLHIIWARSATFKFIAKRMSQIKHLTLDQSSDAKMVLVDQEQKERMFSGISNVLLSTVLRTASIFDELQSLTIGDLGTHGAWADLLARPYPKLLSLTVVVAVTRYSTSSWVPVFQTLDDRVVTCKALTTLRFCHQRRLPDSNVHGFSPLTISATKTVEIIRARLDLGARKLRQLVLEGVLFSEDDPASDVVELRSYVENIVFM